MSCCRSAWGWPLGVGDMVPLRDAKREREGTWSLSGALREREREREGGNMVPLRGAKREREGTWSLSGVLREREGGDLVPLRGAKRERGRRHGPSQGR